MIKKYIFSIILFVLLLPTFVIAKETCNSNDIKIKSIILKDTNGFSEEVKESSINNNTINLNLKMYDVGDSSTYNITIENSSNEEYYFTKDSFKMNTDYLEYSLVNNSEVIPAKSEKTIELRVTYKNKIPNESYSDTNKIIISLSDKPLENPKTYSNNYIILVLLVILIPISIKYHKKGLLILSIFGIVSNVYAVCTVNLNIETKIEIDEREAIFLPGKEVNIKMKELAGDDISTVTNGYTFQDQLITSIKYSSIEPIDSNKEEKNIVSTSDSPYPIYMWYDNGTIYWWSEDIHPSLNEDALSFFYNMRLLTNIDSLKKWDPSSTKYLAGMFTFSSITNTASLKDWDVSNVTNMGFMFNNCTSLESLSGLENWDTSNVVNMASLFAYDIILDDISPIKNWNVSKVENMSSLFTSCYNLEEIDLSHWKTPVLKYMSNMFAMWENGSQTNKGNLKKIIISDNFDTTNVTNMTQTFANIDELEDYSFLEKFNTSNVTSMHALFQKNNFHDNDLQYIKDFNVSKVKDFSYMFFDTKITNVENLKNWNTESAENMDSMFCFTKLLTNLHGLENWNVSNVINMIDMFYGDTNLNDASQINDWNISSTSTFTRMFYNSPTHPEFSKVAGTWNSSGTFIPTT